MDLTIDGVSHKAVVTGGKLAIFEALDAATGDYLFSFDLDMHNVVTEIDSRTGRKTISPAAIPELDQVISQYSMPGICPDWLGARNMQSTAYNPHTKMLYIPISDTCLDDDTGERWQKYPDDSTKGSWGIIKAVNLETQEVVWEQRQTGPQASANLTTDSGLLFIGSVDRWFKALDQDTGEVLWERRLDNALNSYPITYRVDGKQYVAVATNTGGIHTRHNEKRRRDYTACSWRNDVGFRAARLAIGLTSPEPENIDLSHRRRRMSALILRIAN